MGWFRLGYSHSSDFNYNLGERALGGGEASMSVYEAYASANLMGMASMTVGRQALSYGSGALVGTNDWSTNRNTWDGVTLGFDLDMADVSLGYASRNDAATTLIDDVAEEKTNMWLNMGGEFSGWNVNVLYLSNSLLDDAAYGVDIAGGVMGASVSGSMNTDYAGNTMRAINLGYAATDNINLSVGQTAYSDEGQFGADLASDMSAVLGGAGTIGYLGAGDEDITVLHMLVVSREVNASYKHYCENLKELQWSLTWDTVKIISLGLKYADNGDATAEELSTT